MEERKLLDLRCGVEAVDVCRRVCLRVAGCLCCRKYFVERQAFVLHAGEDVVRGAIHDAGDGENLVAYKVVLKRMNDGNAACRRRLAANLHAVLGRERREMLDVAS